jgi:hypothetical protein
LVAGSVLLKLKAHGLVFSNQKVSQVSFICPKASSNEVKGFWISFMSKPLLLKLMAFLSILFELKIFRATYLPLNVSFIEALGSVFFELKTEGQDLLTRFIEGPWVSFLA